MTTLLTGATGYLGSYLTHDLLQRGERVVGLVRADHPPGNAALAAAHPQRHTPYRSAPPALGPTHD